jgi:hypothetical protein
MGGAHPLGNTSGFGDSDITQDDIGNVGGESEDCERGLNDQRKGADRRILHLHL